MKKCAKCMIHKEDFEFTKSGKYLVSYCRSCMKIYRNEKGYYKSRPHENTLLFKEGEKRCSQCHNIKSITEFHLMKKGIRQFTRDYEVVCKSCKSLIQAKNLQERINLDPLYYRKKDLKKKYGLSLQQYSALLESQDNRCAICKIDQDESHKDDLRYSKLYSLFVDHDHDNNLIRGLLCRACNLILGFANEDIQILETSIEYLKEWKEKHSCTINEEVYYDPTEDADTKE